jgi:hypothetical protein
MFQNTLIQQPTHVTTAATDTCATVDPKSNVNQVLGVPKVSRIFAKLENLAKQLLHPKKPVATFVRLDGIKFLVAKRFVPSAKRVGIPTCLNKEHVPSVNHARYTATTAPKERSTPPAFHAKQELFRTKTEHWTARSVLKGNTNRTKDKPVALDVLLVNSWPTKVCPPSTTTN